MTAQEAAPSQSTSPPSPTVAVQLVATPWQATLQPSPQETEQLPAFWHCTEQPLPHVVEQEGLPLAQYVSQAGCAPQACWQDSPVGQKQ